MVPVIIGIGALFFLSSVKLNTQDTVGIAVGLMAVLWVSYFVIQRYFSRAINRLNVSQGSGFRVMAKDRIRDEHKSQPSGRKFYSQGLFQVIHKGQRYQAPDDEERLFKMPIYRKPPEGHKPVLPRPHFGTAGIRGLTNTEITPLLALKMSEIYGAYLSEKRSVGRIKAAVGYDSRYGAAMLAMSAISGLNSAGIDTADCGCITTGGLASYISCHKLDGGVLITGSHTPYDRIGFIILTSDGSYLDIESSRELERRYENYGQSRRPAGPEGIGVNSPAVAPSDC